MTQDEFSSLPPGPASSTHNHPQLTGSLPSSAVHRNKIRQLSGKEVEKENRFFCIVLHAFVFPKLFVCHSKAVRLLSQLETEIKHMPLPHIVLLK